MSSSRYRYAKTKKLKNYLKYGRTTATNPKSRNPTSLELEIYSLLNEYNIEFEREYQILGTSKWFDMFIPKLNMLIEVDGEYWHPLKLNESSSEMDCRNFKNDRFKDKLALRYGYKLIRIRENSDYKSAIINIYKLYNNI